MKVKQKKIILVSPSILMYRRETGRGGVRKNDGTEAEMVSIFSLDSRGANNLSIRERGGEISGMEGDYSCFQLLAKLEWSYFVCELSLNNFPICGMDGVWEMAYQVLTFRIHSRKKFK